MKRIALAIISVFVYVGGCAVTPSNTTTSDFNEANYTLRYNQGLNRLQNNEPSYAMEDFLIAEKYKKTPDLYFSMGQACYMLKRNELALKYFDKSLALDRNFSSSNVGKGIILREMGKYDEAYEFIKKASSYDPDHPEIIADMKMIEDALRHEAPKEGETLSK